MSSLPERNAESLKLAEPPDDGLDYWGMLLRRKWIVLPCIGISMVIAYAVYLTSPPVYTSDSTMVIEVNNRNVGVDAVETTSDDGADIETQMILIRSPRIVGRAIQEFQLAELPSLAGVTNPVQFIIDGLSLFHQPETEGVLHVSYRGLNRDDCQTILEAVFASYRAYLRETHQTVNEETVQLVSRAKNELLAQLNEAEGRYREFKRNAPPVLIGGTTGEDTNIHRMRLASIEQQRSQLLLQRTNLRGQIQAIENARKSGGSEEVLAFVVGNMRTNSDASQPQTLADRIFPLMLEEHRLLRKVGEDHPQVKDVREQIEFTRGFTEGLVVNNGEDSTGQPPDFLDIYVASLRQQIQINQDQEAELNKQFELERLAARKYLDIEGRHDVFRNDIARKKALFDAIVKRLSEMSLMKDFGGLSMQVVLAPTPAFQVGPSLMRHLGLGGGLGFALGFVLAFWRERADKRFRAPEDISDVLRSPVVAHIPSIPATDAVALEDSLIDRMVCTYHQPQSLSAESYRAARVALYFSTQGETNKVFQITSPSPGDGKSTLSSNLAVSIANSGKRTLLVEGDFRRPRVHEIIGLDATVGLPAVLTGQAELNDAIYETEVENLWCVPCGMRPSNPAELLSSPKFKQFLSTVRQKFDYVIIDSPPVLAVTDACSIAADVDGVYLTMRLKKNSRGLASRAAEMLRAVGGNLLGVVVNGAGNGPNYGYGYSNYSYYGKDSYGASNYGCYGYGATVKEAAGYYLPVSEKPQPPSQPQAVPAGTD